MARLRDLAWRHAGVERTGDGLAALLDDLDGLGADSEALGGEGRNLLLAARVLATAALERTESRGGHYRADHPEAVEAWRRHLAVELDETGEPRTVRLPLLGGEPGEELPAAVQAEALHR